MKLNKLLMVALAGMTMFSCSNNDEMDNGLSNEKKAVVLRLDGVSTPKSRSVIDAITTDNTAMTLSSVKIFFCSNTTIYKEVSASSDATANSDEAKLWTDLTNSGTNKLNIFEVDAAVNQVIVVGNPETDKYNSLTTVAALQEVALSLKKENTAVTGPADQTTKNNVTLYGTGPLVAVDGQTDYTHTATVEITPLISRIEVNGFSCTFNENDATLSHRFNKIIIKGIGMVDYYNTMNIAGTVSDLKDRNTPSNEQGKIYKNETESGATLVEGGYVFCDATRAADYTWSFDTKVSNEENANDLALEFTYTQDQTTPVTNETKFAYNFFVPATSPAFPNIMVLTDVTDTESTPVEGKKYIMTTEWGSVTPQRGYIYTFTYNFNENDLGDWDTKDLQKVLVTVTATPWKVVPVTPDIN